MKKFHASGVVFSLMVLASARDAAAIKYGNLHISKNTTLTDHQYGSVVFDVGDITLDCNGKQVHISSSSAPNCRVSPADSNLVKCGILAAGRDNVTIRNCNVIGDFDYGVAVQYRGGAKVTNVSAYGAKIANVRFHMASGTATNLKVGGPHIGLLLDQDFGGHYEGIQVEPGAEIGISVNAGQSSQVVNSSVEGARLGLWASGSGLYFSGLQITGSTEWGASLGHFNDSALIDSFFWDNAQGVSVERSHVSEIVRNHLIDSGECDAWQDNNSNHVTWWGNEIGTPCGTVPTRH